MGHKTNVTRTIAPSSNTMRFRRAAEGEVAIELGWSSSNPDTVVEARSLQFSVGVRAPARTRPEGHLRRFTHGGLIHERRRLERQMASAEREGPFAVGHAH